MRKLTVYCVVTPYHVRDFHFEPYPLIDCTLARAIRATEVNLFNILLLTNQLCKNYAHDGRIPIKELLETA